jgi:hypothetical protein
MPLENLCSMLYGASITLSNLLALITINQEPEHSVFSFSLRDTRLFLQRNTRVTIIVTYRVIYI